MTVVAKNVEQEDVAAEQRVHRGIVQLPPTRIALIPFSLVEVELLPEED